MCLLLPEATVFFQETIRVIRDLRQQRRFVRLADKPGAPGAGLRCQVARKTPLTQIAAHGSGREIEQGGGLVGRTALVDCSHDEVPEVE
jgi:hypothetical protein